MIIYKYLVPIAYCVERQLHGNTTWSWLNLDNSINFKFTTEIIWNYIYLLCLQYNHSGWAAQYEEPTWSPIFSYQISCVRWFFNNQPSSLTIEWIPLYFKTIDIRAKFSLTVQTSLKFSISGPLLSDYRLIRKSSESELKFAFRRTRTWKWKGKYPLHLTRTLLFLCTQAHVRCSIINIILITAMNCTHVPGTVYCLLLHWNQTFAVQVSYESVGNLTKFISCIVR